jgi:ABC-type Fe3+-siderophore transport system permease subunit
MKRKQHSFWLRFIFFFIVFAVALFLMVFLVNRNPVDNFRMLLIKIGIRAILTSLLYNIFTNPDHEVAD